MGMFERFKKQQKQPKHAVERRLRANSRSYNDQFDYARNFIRTSKYNVFTFLPKNLFEQFQRLANFYFLILMILQLIPEISSLTSLTTILPLVAVLLLTAAKDAFDDLQRHRSDNQVNNRKSLVVRDGKLVEEKWQNVRVGDVIRIENDNFIAADLLLLSTSEPHGLCYVETAELDGETNLKARQALPETASMLDDLSRISSFDGDVVCEPPNNNLSYFEGRLNWLGGIYSLDNEKMLLRGCVLRNTRWCYGLVIFAGRDTKLMMNSGKTFFKRTSLDRFLNVLIIGIVLFLLSMCSVCAVLCGIWEWTTGKDFQLFLPWASFADQKDGTATVVFIAFLVFFSYVILLNTVVPISLYVSVEIIRVCHSWWINWDRCMYHEPTDSAARARTTTLNEELGQVQYIFSDKTGTLTQNIMIFNKCSINGQIYGDDDCRADGKPINFAERNRWADPRFVFYDRRLVDHTQQAIAEVDLFWRCLALCHTVMSDMKNDKLEYQAQSPDEAALTSAAGCFGYVFLSRTPKTITIEVQGVQEDYELLSILDFNNYRKRMSVVVRRQGQLQLYCKGADTIVLQRVRQKPDHPLHAATQTHLDKFAGDGLRTLCLAYKPIDEAYFRQWMARCSQASVSMDRRQDKLDAIYDELETDMQLIGATAIEDKLQEGVPETIANLMLANIKIWVLTGDKQETAINIGYSCRLLTPAMKDVLVVDGRTADQVKKQLETYDQLLRSSNGGSSSNSVTTDHVCVGDRVVVLGNHQQLPSIAENGPTSVDDEERSDDYALVINGQSLIHALTRSLEVLFLTVATGCKAVICCRATPLQKALVVNLIKRNQKAVTLAVGDGANDVSMIKTAHIGVGISGQEGMQAVLASDFCIGQFRFLERLLLVHGRWSYYRMSKFLQYFFYKNFAFTLAHFWYAFFCGYSAQTIYDPLFITCYNLFFTALPVIGTGIFDQDVSDTSGIAYPQLYIPGQRNSYFNMRIFTHSVLRGFFSSGVLFFTPYFALSDNINHDGDTSPQGMWQFSFTIFTALIVTVTAQIALDTAYWTTMNHVFVWGSVTFYIFVAVLYYELLPFNVLHQNGYGTALQMMAYSNFWLTILLITVMLIIPHASLRLLCIEMSPSLTDRVRIKQNLKRLSTGLKDIPLQPTSSRRYKSSTRRRRQSTRSSYAFSHHPGFGKLITEGINVKPWRNMSAMLDTLKHSASSAFDTAASSLAIGGRAAGQPSSPSNR